MAAWPRFPGTIPPAASGRDSLDGMPDWGALRADFPLLDRYVYFNACSLGPLPRSGRAALSREARSEERCSCGSTCRKQPEVLRSEVALRKRAGYACTQRASLL